MIESPVTPTTEVPVSALDLFLSNKVNLAVLEGKLTIPQSPSLGLGREALFGVLVLVIFMGYIVLTLTNTPVGFFGVVFAGAVVVFLLILISLSFPNRKAIPQNRAGTLLDGVVTNAEKLITRGRYDSTEEFNILYRFTAPGGIVTDSKATVPTKHSTHTMAPAPDTPVKVWYLSENEHWLL